MVTSRHRTQVFGGKLGTSRHKHKYFWSKFGTSMNKHKYLRVNRVPLGVKSVLVDVKKIKALRF